MEKIKKIQSCLGIGALSLALVAVVAGCATPAFTIGSAQEAAQKGDAKAQYFLGNHFADGDGMPQDLHKAVDYMRKSADQGYAKAENNLGIFYAQGIGVTQDYAEAIKWFRLAAKQGDPLAEYSLGLSYQLGRGVETNIAEAIKWYQRSAAQHQPEANLALGEVYLGGGGQPPNYREAARWYRRAAAQNSAAALNDLGLIYEQGGFGLVKNLPLAVTYYRQAAEAGDGKGQLNLGRMYLEGTEVPKDFTEAYKWFYLAARNGGGVARHYLSELNGTANFGDFTGPPLTDDQVREAIRQARKFEKNLAQKQPKKL